MEIGLIPLCLLLKNAFSSEIKDRFHPFGGDEIKLKKYTKLYRNDKEINKCEESGVQVFWGKPSRKDTLKQSLDKIEWLSTNYNYETIWRRCFIYSVAFTVILTIILKLGKKDIDKILTLVLILFLAFYMTRSYEKCHIQKPKTKFITRHINKIKKKLNIDGSNDINNFSLL